MIRSWCRAATILAAFAILSAPTIAVARGPITASSTEALNPFVAVSRIVDWFDRLDQRWSRIVSDQEREQLVRSIDRLRQQLYSLHGDSEMLLASVPDVPPDLIERGQLRSQSIRLHESLSALRQSASELMLELGAQDQPAANLVIQALVARTGALNYIDAQLLGGRAWRPDEIRGRMYAGLAALERAQIAVTRFRNRLAAQRSDAARTRR